MRVSVASAKVLFLAAVGVALALALVGEPAWAGTQVEDPVAEVTNVINFNKVKIRGRYVEDVFTNHQPFFTQVYAAGGECLRLDVDIQEADLEMVVASPICCSVWRNDDRSIVDARPLIKIDPTPGAGYYTVQIAYFSTANLGTDAGFRLSYGRYNSGSANCASPTPSLGPSQGKAETTE